MNPYQYFPFTPLGQETSARDILPLMQEASRAAAAAREAGDHEEYLAQRKRLESLNAIYRGFGQTEDFLELERAKQGLPGVFEEVGDIAKWGTAGILALMAWQLLK